jgi:hypothetical protein
MGNGTKSKCMEMVINSKNSLGKIFYDDGSYYEGSFNKNMRHGIGLFIEKCGNYFIGEF